MRPLTVALANTRSVRLRGRPQICRADHQSHRAERQGVEAGSFTELHHPVVQRMPIRSVTWMTRNVASRLSARLFD